MYLAIYFTILFVLKYASSSQEVRGVYNASYTPPFFNCKDSLLNLNVKTKIVAFYEGSVARMFCGLNRSEVSWMYAKSLNETYTSIVQKDRLVIQDTILYIYRARAEDAGIYRCQTNSNLQSTVILEVVDDEYVLVTESNTSESKSSDIGQEPEVNIVWSQWSECSSKTRSQRRFGMCHVKLKAQNYFAAFPEGIPCRSRHLPDEIRNSPKVRTKSNEIMIRKCVVQNVQKIFEFRSLTGVILEKANNTAGFYSLAQELPPQPPAPVRNILFVGRGQRVLVKCPGTTLRDIPVTWRAGNLLVDPGVLRESSAGRVGVDARDRIVIAHLLYEDDNLYSCWEGGNLAGTVKVVVWAGRQARWNHHSALAAMALSGALLLNLAMRMLFTAL